MKEIYRDPISISLGVTMPVTLLALFESILIGIASNIYWVVGYAVLFLIAGIFSFSWKIKV